VSVAEPESSREGSGGALLRLLAKYTVESDSGRIADLARALAVELTVEVPEEVIGRYPHLNRDLIAQVEEVRAITPALHQITLSFCGDLPGVDLPGADLTRWLNLLLGNASMLPGVRLHDLEIPNDLVAAFQGPRHGIDGIREWVGVPERPLLATALKPRGAPVSDLQMICREFVHGGGDLIKDDHNLIDDSNEQFLERVKACVGSIREAENRRRILYLVNLMGPAEELDRRLELAHEAGADGGLVAPWVLGLDRTRQLIDDHPGVYLGHPSLSGVYTRSGGGISPGLIHGTFARLAGIDGSVFVNAGGRFSPTREEGRSVAHKLAEPLGNLRRGWAVPAGGMSPERVPEILSDYGSQVMILIGGAIIADARGVRSATESLREAIDQTLVSE